MPHRPNHRGRQYRRNYAHGGPHARANEFRNRRTGQAVPAGAPYHIHPDKGPMEGAVHNPDIPGGTAGHDFYDRVNGNSTSNNRMNGRTSSGGGYRRGGRTRRRMEHGGHTHQPNLMQTGYTTAGGTHHTHLIDFQNQGQGTHNHSSHTRARSIQTSAPDPRTWDRPYNRGPYIQELPIMGPHLEWMRKGGRTSRRMEHGGSHCGPGLMYQNGGCVSYEHGGHHQVVNSDSDRQRRKR